MLGSSVADEATVEGSKRREEMVATAHCLRADVVGASTDGMMVARSVQRFQAIFDARSSFQTMDYESSSDGSWW